jgi:hypothetical protein
MGWSEKYKKSIDCNNPKGFSQKAHCQGKKKRNENIMKLSELKETIVQVIEAKRGRGVGTIQKDITAVNKKLEKTLEDIQKALDFYKKNKNTDKAQAFIKVLKKLGDQKKSYEADIKKLYNELDAKVTFMYKDAEYNQKGGLF